MRKKSDFRLDMNEVDVYTARGSGPGGQHRNKTDTAVRMVHRPTGLTSYADGRSQSTNKDAAASILSAKIEQRQQNAEEEKYNAARRKQVGNRQRSNKIRTYNFLRNEVIDHRTGKKSKNLKEFLKGKLYLCQKS